MRLPSRSFLQLEVSFLYISVDKTMDIRASSPELWRVVKEMPRSDAKPLGQAFLRHVEAFGEDPVFGILINVRSEAMD